MPPTATNVIAIAAGASHSLALASNGTVIGWGAAVPGTPPEGLSNVVSISAGLGQSLALKADGTLVAWGAPRTPATTNIPAGLNNVVAIACGDDHNLALRADGTIYAWGANYSGQTNILTGLSNVVAIAAGNSGNFALRADGTVWGSHVPAAISTNYTNIIAGAIVARGDQGAVVLGNGTAVAWGYGGTELTNLPLIRTASSRSGFNQAGATWLLRRDGTLVGLGAQYLGQPEVYENLTNVLAVAAGYFHHLAIVGETLPLSSTSAMLPRWQSGRFSVSQPTLRGMSYWLEYKNAPEQPDWHSCPPLPGDGSVKRLFDDNAAVPMRFYRVQGRP